MKIVSGVGQARRLTSCKTGACILSLSDSNLAKREGEGQTAPSWG